MKKLILLLLVSLNTLIVFGQTHPNDLRFAGMDIYADSVLKQFHIAGFAVAVVENDKVIYAKGFGYRDEKKKLPVTPNTVFPINSCTKAFTDALCGILVNEGKLGLDQPVRDYVSWFRFYNEYTTEHATIRDLMAHRTGLPRHDQVSDFFDNSQPRDSLIYRIRYLQPFAELRQKYQYNNLMYTVLGVVTEKLTGQSYEQNIAERLLKPLDMSNTSLSATGLMASPDHSLGYYYDEQKGQLMAGDYGNEPNPNCPAGGICSSVADMSKWLIAWLNGGKYNGKQVIPDWYVKEAIRPQTPIDNYNYGLGWYLSAFRGGHFRVEHSGTGRFSNSTVCFYPSANGYSSPHKIGIVVLSNEFGDYLTSLIRDYLSDKLLNEGRKDLPGSNGEWSAWFPGYKAYFASMHKPNTGGDGTPVKPSPLSHPVNAYTGKYYNAGYRTIEIYLKGDQLQARFNRVDLSLKHFNFDVFDASPGGKLKFNTDNDGKIADITMPLEEMVSDIVFERTK
ncbi:serine hydrolase [Mucilaginibacter dorajii]|uniref:Serine hydrolase n=1 Tax=Mucilaginibacter dorajii TaxID=692994 RepID=A0ABP7P324_9SPHI|nr:serine hydrolase [Mucilaginibacter dorajii]MCS3734322.1 CubicO group peptidase (beta-lactamase class C family) [Mucilaginibacter dorajii]